ncbi:MAG TPA: hypothetical protein VFS00_09665 [Polyangiaceae bacterium]|nr:hypothetical protein [Polyangiaceae bacterium]
MLTHAKTTNEATTTRQPPPNGKKAGPRRAEKKGASGRAKKVAREAPTATSTDATAGVPPEEAARAFERVRPELAATPAAERGRITVAIPVAVSTALGALPNLAARRDELQRAWPAYDVARADRLRDYAYAALYAHFLAARPAKGSRLRDLLAEAAPLRERLLLTAEVHARYGDLDAERVASIRRGLGHHDTANDLVELAILFRAARAALAGHTPVTDAEIARALELGTQVLDALGRRRVGTEVVAAPRREEEERIKAFWLFFDVYEDSRRAMAHLRWHEGDADQLAPSLFSGRRRRSVVEAPDDPEAPSKPVEPVEPFEPVDPVDPAESDERAPLPRPPAVPLPSPSRSRTARSPA